MVYSLNALLISISAKIALIIFISGITACFLLFILYLILSIVKPCYDFNKKRWFLVVCCGIICLQAGLLVVLGEGLALSLISIGLAVIEFCALTAIRVKDIAVTGSQKELIGSLDGVIQKEKAFIKDKDIERLSCQPIASQPKKENIDYTHIKNVIERLGYFGLTPSDKNVVSQLELAILRAERGECDYELKREINDGLGALLKIMSKYGA